LIENKNNGANLDFKVKLRCNVDAAVCKHVVLGLIILKYISDAFMEKRADFEVKTTEAKNDLFIKDTEARFGVLVNHGEYLPKSLSTELELPAIEMIGEGAV
jgi:type I restriction-modification system DNA methylase subunit